MKKQILKKSCLFAVLASLSYAAHSLVITSMTISDVDGDGLAGCFKFSSLNPNTCDAANQFSSDGSVSGSLSGLDATIPGIGNDFAVDGNPVGIRFGFYQNVGEISPGFLFGGFPMVPITFNPPSESAPPPAGNVTINGAAILNVASLPFGFMYYSATPNAYYLDPDVGTLFTQITANNNDGTFDYLMTWSHIITAAEDPTGTFTNLNAFLRLEGVVSTSIVPATQAIWLFGPGLLGLVGLARRKKAA